MVRTHEPWEEVLDAPLTLASLPFRAMGSLAKALVLHIQEDNVVPRLTFHLAVIRSSGIGVRSSKLGDRSGLGAGLDFAPPLFGGWLRAGVAASMRNYNRERVELGPRWLFAGYVYDWRPQERFYGIGEDSRERYASDYALQSQRAELRLQLVDGTRLRRELGAWVGERQSVLLRGRERHRPSFEESFPELAAGALGVEQDHFVTGARAALDTRAGGPHWSHGWRLGAQAERLEASDQGVLFEGSDGSPGFHRFTFEGQVGWSFMRDPRTLRLAARVVDLEPFDPNQPPTVFDLSRLGGSAGLAGFEPGRFHGLDSFVAKLGYVFPLAQYMELEMSTEVGAVSGDVWRETRIDHLEQSYTVMLRPRTARAPMGAVGVSWSREAMRIGYSIGGVE